MTPARLGLAAAALTVVLWLIGVLTPRHAGRTMSLDLTWYFYPTYDAFFGALRAGAPMLWNPYQLCGHPWLGTLQGAFFYPPHLLYVLLPTPWALALSTVLHLALAAGGTMAFARRVGVSTAGATLAVMLFVGAGKLRNQQLWPYLFEASAWIPIGALAVAKMTGGRAGRGTLLLAFASGMSWLAGSPQATVYACYGWAGLFVALVVRRPFADVLRASGAFAAGLAAGVLLGAVALLPAFELAGEGMRRTSTLDVDLMYPFGVYRPGALWDQWLGSGPKVLLLGALVLAPFALVSRSPALALWGLVTAAGAAAFSLGPTTRLFDIYLALPAVGWFRIPPRVQVVGQFALAIVAALGLDAITGRLRQTWVAPLVVLALLAAVVVDGFRRPPIAPPLPYREAAAPYTAAQRESYARLAAAIGEARAWPYSVGLVRVAQSPKLPTLAHLRSIDDYEPLVLRRQRDYFVFFTENATPTLRRLSDLRIALDATPGQPPPATRRRLLDLAGVRFMIVPPQTLSRPEVASFVRDAGLERRPSLAADLELLENPHALPRAFVTYRVRPAPPAAELLPLLARSSFDPLAESWVEGDAGLPPAEPASPRGTVATIVRDDPHVVEIDATLAEPGLVVLADTYYPGWTATVNGKPAPILPTNHLFRGVPAQAGEHRIRFAYRPRSLALGAALSMMAALALAVGACRR